MLQRMLQRMGLMCMDVSYVRAIEPVVLFNNAVCLASLLRRAYLIARMWNCCFVTLAEHRVSCLYFSTCTEQKGHAMTSDAANQ